MKSKLRAYRGVFANGELKLAEPAQIPEGSAVRVIVLDLPNDYQVSHARGPRLADRRQASDFEMEIEKDCGDSIL